MMENQPIPTTEALPRRLSEVLLDGARCLVSADIDTARLDAELLLGHVLGMTREQLVVDANRLLSPEQSEQYQSFLLRRLQREPVAYITGRREFWSLDFCVSSDVLIPRPETEVLVEVTLKLAAPSGAGQALRILDVGTGSGAIAVALASELPAAEIFATDVSEAALSIARRNALRHQVAKRIRFLQGDLFGALSEIREGFHLIVSNPPYIRHGEIADLDPEVSLWEPRSALDGGFDGLDFYRRIAAEAFRRLPPNGAVALEIGADMGAAVTALFEKVAAYAHVKVYQDYSGKDRIVVAHRDAGARSQPR